MLSKKEELEMAREELILGDFDATRPAPPEDVPTEREWFNLFTNIAASLKVQADAVVADQVGEEALNKLMKEFGLGELTAAFSTPEEETDEL